MFLQILSKAFLFALYQEIYFLTLAFHLFFYSFLICDRNFKKVDTYVAQFLCAFGHILLFYLPFLFQKNIHSKYIKKIELIPKKERALQCLFDTREWLSCASLWSPRCVQAWSIKKTVDFVFCQQSKKIYDLSEDFVLFLTDLIDQCILIDFNIIVSQ